MDAVFLNLLIFVPLLGAILIWTLPERREALAPRISLWIGLVTGGIAIGLWLKSTGTGLIAETNWNWIAIGSGADASGGPVSGIRIAYHLGLDAISAPLLALTGLLVPLSIACSFTYIRTRIR